MKKLFIVASCAMLTACYKGYYTQDDLDFAAQLCTGNGGIEKLVGVSDADGNLVTALLCKNGAAFPAKTFKGSRK